MLGVKRILRVGTCGGLQADMKLGDLIVALTAVPADATARHLIGEPHVPTADWELVHGAVHAAKELGKPVRVGPIVSSDIFYNPDSGQYQRWSERGVLAVEMEAAILFTLGALRKIKTGCLLTVSDVVIEGEFIRISDEEMRAAVDQMTELALHTVTAEREALAAPGPSSSSTPRLRAAPRAAAGRSSPARPPRSGSPATRSSRSSPGISASSPAQRSRAARRCSSPSAATARSTRSRTGSSARRAPSSAVIPRGTGGDFVRTFGIPSKLEDAVRVALEGRTRTIDLGRAAYRAWDGEPGESYFANIASAGMSGAVAKRTNEATQAPFGGKVAYLWSTVVVFARWRNAEVKVTVDGEVRSGPMFDVIVANCRYLAGGMKICPGGGARRRPARRPADRRREQARPGADDAEDLPRDASAAPEGRAPARRVGHGRGRGAAAGRARRRAARDDAGAVRRRSRCASASGSGLGAASSSPWASPWRAWRACGPSSCACARSSSAPSASPAQSSRFSIAATRRSSGSIRRSLVASSSTPPRTSAIALSISLPPGRSPIRCSASSPASLSRETTSFSCVFRERAMPGR